MDILIDAVIFGLQKAGGISRVWADLLLALNDSAFRVGILVPTNQNVEWNELANRLPNIQIFKRRRFRWDKTMLWSDSLYLTTVYHKLRPRIWHSSYYVGYPFFASNLFISYHDMIAEKTGNIHPYDHKCKFYALQKADIIFSPSVSAYEDLRYYWPAFASKVHIIPHGLSCSTIQDMSFPDPYFLFVGKREGYKSFLPAISEILNDPLWKAYKIVVVGGENTPTLIHPRLHYLHTLAYPQVLGLMQKATALIFPSHYEGFGLPVLEALSLGVPVLARDCSSIPEITGPAYPLVKDNNFSTVLKQLLDNRNQWITYGKERAQLFSQQHCWQRYKHYYEQVLNSH